MITPSPTPIFIALTVLFYTTSATDASVQSQHKSRAASLLRLVTRNVFNIAAFYPLQVNVLARLALMKFKASPLKLLSILFVYLDEGGSCSYRMYIPHFSVAFP